MPRRVLVLATCLSLAVALAPLAARAQDTGAAARAAAPRGPAAPTTPAGLSDQDRALLRQMADAQKWAGEQIWAIKEAADALPGTLNEVKEQIAGAEDETRKLRDEVKGLYVEIASLREELDAARADVAGVGANLSSFRSFSSVFIAAMILALLLIAMMTILRR